MGMTLREALNTNINTAGVHTSSDALLNKWKPELDIIRESLGNKFTEDRALTTAVLMDNTSRRVESAVSTRRMFESIQPSDVKAAS